MFFARQQYDSPALWNGRLLLMREMSIADGLPRAAFFETDYASQISDFAEAALPSTADRIDLTWFF